MENSTYASQLLTHAESLYSVANSTTPRQTYYTALGDEVAAYASSDWRDNLCASALALALATNNSAYYADAYNYYVQYGLSGTHEVWNWDSSQPAIYVMFAEIASAKPELAQGAGLDVNLTGWQTEVENYFDGLIKEDFSNSYLTEGEQNPSKKTTSLRE